MKRLRVAVIGAGSIARRYHLPALKRLSAENESIALSAVCDTRVERAEAARESFGFQTAYENYRAMLDAESPDALWVLVPYPVMRQIAGSVLSQGIPTLMEKPPGSNARETLELAEIAARHDAPNQVAFNRRYAPLITRMKALLAESGPVEGLSCQFFRHDRLDPHFAYGTGLHGLDALRFLGPGEVVEINTRESGRGSALVTLGFDDGTLATMEMRPRVGARTERYTAHAADRTVVIDGFIDWLTHYPGYLHCYDRAVQSLTIENDSDVQSPDVIAGFYGEDRAFAESLLAGERPTPSLEEALRSVELAEAVDQGASRAFFAS